MKLVFVIDNDQELLPHFYRHYKRLGVDEFCCITCFTEVRFPDITVVGEIKERTDRVSALTRDAINRFIQTLPPKEWWLISDLDEFHEYSKPVPDLIAECDRGDYTCVLGDLLDHVAVDGSLPVLKNCSIYEQFPKTVELTKALGACTQKVMLAKGNLTIESGNHFINGNPHPTRGIVHHYKWHSKAVDRIKTRYDEYCRLGVHWITELEEFYRHFDGTLNKWL